MSAAVSSAGVQQLYNDGLLPAGVAQSVLNNASAAQLNQLAKSASALQETGALFGFGEDSVSLSSTAGDSLTQAVSNALTSSVDAAASQFLPQNASSSTGSLINLLG